MFSLATGGRAEDDEDELNELTVPLLEFPRLLFSMSLYALLRVEGEERFGSGGGTSKELKDE